VSRSPASEPGGRWGQALRTPGFGRILLAAVVSAGGAGISGLCATWLVFQQTGSALDIAYLGVGATVAAATFGLVGGVFVDRYDRRGLMVASDLGRAAATGGFVLSVALTGFRFVDLLAAASVTAGLTALFQPAEQAYVPQLVPAERLADANGLLIAAQVVVGIVASGVAGLLIVTVGAVAGLGASVLTFSASAAVLLSLPARAFASGPRALAARSSVRRFFVEAKEGFVWLARRTGLLGLTLGSMAFNFFSGLALAFLVFYSADALRGSALVFAALLIASGIGGTLGGLLVGRLNAVRRAGLTFGISYGVVCGLALVAMAEVPAAPVALVAVFLIGTTVSFAGNVWLTFTQRVVPTEIQGRYYGIDTLVSLGMVPASQIVGGLLVEHLGVRETYLIAGVGWAAAGLVFLAFRSVRTLSLPPEGPSDRPDRASSPGAPPPDPSRGS
jgi:MFS family permease